MWPPRTRRVSDEDAFSNSFDPRFEMTHRKLFLLAVVGLLGVPAPSAAQGVGLNGKARTYVSYLQVRDLVQDSVLAAAVPGEGSQRTLDDGTRVSCAEGWCRFYRSGSDIGTVPFLQDFEFNAWSGITGLRGYAHVRFRQSFGDGSFWPRMDSEIEALTAYVEYRRSNYQVKAGRIWESTALGFYNYDGGSFQVRLPTQLDLNVYGGLSLVRGLNQLHHTDLIGSVEPLNPREDAYLMGFNTRWRPYPGLAAAFTYQRETTTHTSDLYSERIAGSARALISRATVDLEVKYDLAAGNTNLARLAVAAPLGAGLRASGEVRKYLPYFDLWTIWGAFSPVGYKEARGRLDWMSPTGKLSARAYGSYLQYGDTDTGDLPSGQEIRNDAWRFAAGGRYAFNNDLVLDGEYHHDVGYGASRSGGDASLQKTFGPGRYLGVRGTAFESFSEFRVGSGRVIGGGIQGALPIGSANLQGSAMLYKHEPSDQPRILDLNQARLNLILEIPIGNDPGMARGGAR
jgi:hypothetical protein